MLRKHFVCAHLPELNTRHLVADPDDVALLEKYNRETKGMLVAGEREVFLTPDGELCGFFLSLNTGKAQYTDAVRRDPAKAVDKFFELAAKAAEKTHGKLPDDWAALRDGTAPEVAGVADLKLPAPRPVEGKLALRVSVRGGVNMYEGLVGAETVLFSAEEERLLAADGEWPDEHFKRLARTFYTRGGGVHVEVRDASIVGSIRAKGGRLEGSFELRPKEAAERSKRESFRPWIWSKGRLAGDYTLDPKTGRFSSLRLAAVEGQAKFELPNYGDKGVHELHVGVELLR